MDISILLITYNHGKFVRQALESIIMQKLNVSYEIIIFDDASTDETPEILREYKKKYPQLISLYLKTVNSGWPTRNSYYALSKASGRYYAVLEGDDYWTDEQKLQKQYDFLETHKEYSACVANTYVVDEESNEITNFCVKLYDKKDDQIFTLEDFRHIRYPGRAGTLFARNYFDRENYRILYEADKMMGDITLYMLCLLKGNIYQMDEVMGAYRYVRKAGKGNFNSIHQGNIYRNYIQTRYWIRLGNYMQRYDDKFEFASITGIIGQAAHQYPIKPVVSLLMTARHRKKYLLIYFVQKFLSDSDFVMEEIKCSDFNHCSWNRFLTERKLIIIFGAGATAIEYIDKYAWKGNISFLVDNDKEKHGTSMKGFLIKNPEEIIKYKGKSIVLITSKDYEREIAMQLQTMGIDNYYCYCSMQTRRIRNRIANILLEKLNN